MHADGCWLDVLPGEVFGCAFTVLDMRGDAVVYGCMVGFVDL
jgi:hypothetical protein